MRIIGYTYEAAEHCPECTRFDYECGNLDVDHNAWRDLKVGTDEHGLPDALTDMEGDEVGVIFDITEGSHFCDDCRKELD